MNRRDFIKTAALAAPLTSSVAFAQSEAQILRRGIPKSTESLPVIGLGTWQTFDVGDDPETLKVLSQVLNELVEAGASVVDSSPMYGRSEAVVGELAEALGVNDKLFKATKVWTTGKAQGVTQMRDSLRKMRAKTIDLMQVHNLVDAQTHLQTLADWKEQGLVRYVGLTHYHSGGYAELSRLMQAHELDFIQINYSIVSREVEQRVFPIAKERNIGVIINRPFEAGRLFAQVRDKPLPDFAAEFDCTSWGQFFLKFIIANPVVTCVIPGTSKLKHLQDNLAAGRGRLPNAEHLQKMLKIVS